MTSQSIANYFGLCCAANIQRGHIVNRALETRLQAVFSQKDLNEIFKDNNGVLVARASSVVGGSEGATEHHTNAPNRGSEPSPAAREVVILVSADTGRNTQGGADSPVSGSLSGRELKQNGRSEIHLAAANGKKIVLV